MAKGFSVSVTLRVRHGYLRKALEERGWTQKQLAEHLGMNQTRISELINLKRRPHRLSDKQIKKLMELTGKSIEELWPDSIFSSSFLKADKALEVIREMPVHELAARHILQLPGRPDEELEKKELTVEIERVLSGLTKRQERVVRMHLLEGQTFSAIADALNISVQRVRRIFMCAIRRLRHPAQKRILRDYLNLF